MSRAEPLANEPRWCGPAAVLAVVAGLGLMAASAYSLSATYDEVAYLRIAAKWWRTGSQNEITRMGSPLTFWKLQQGPVLWLLDQTGQGGLIDEPIARQADLLPLVRMGAFWVWGVALGLTSWWSRVRYGPRAMAFSAWLFALSPNLIGHGAILTMEMPIIATTVAVFALFMRFLETGRRALFFGAAGCCGVAFSCKFTAVLIPVLLAMVWWVDLSRWGRSHPLRAFVKVALAMVLFLGVMLLADVIITGGAVLTLSNEPGAAHPSVEGRFVSSPSFKRILTRVMETPIPQDWVGFAAQIRHQRSGGPSYLLGERRMTGWWYYYFVALSVKVPLSFWLLAVARTLAGRASPSKERDWIFPLTIAAFLAITAAGSSRNYGVRYLLPMAPLAIVWVSSLAEMGKMWRLVACLGLLGQGLAVASVYPDELTYFNALCGGREGGRRVLSDSNLDWGQGLKSLARLQKTNPELRDLTLFYFGETKPEYYGVIGASHTIDAGSVHPGLPERFGAKTKYIAVSVSLVNGPWGPPGYFRRLEGVRPYVMTDDTTIAVYRASGLVPD